MHSINPIKEATSKDIEDNKKHNQQAELQKKLRQETMSNRRHTNERHVGNASKWDTCNSNAQYQK